MHKSPTRLEIIVTENNPADARLTVEALKEIGRSEGVVCLPDRDDALGLLRGEGRWLHNCIA